VQTIKYQDKSHGISQGNSPCDFCCQINDFRWFYSTLTKIFGYIC